VGNADRELVIDVDTELVGDARGLSESVPLSLEEKLEKAVAEAAPERDADDVMVGTSLAGTVGNGVELTEPDSVANADVDGFGDVETVIEAKELFVTETEKDGVALTSGDCDSVIAPVLENVATGAVVTDVDSVRELDADTLGDDETDVDEDTDTDRRAEADTLPVPRDEEDGISEDDAQLETNGVDDTRAEGDALGLPEPLDERLAEEETDREPIGDNDADADSDTSIVRE
jgi:hypothetical protein